jgi:hypothetical protein
VSKGGGVGVDTIRSRAKSYQPTWVWPDLHGFTRFVAGKRMNMKNTMNTTHKSKANTHTQDTPVVLVGPIHQLNRITRKRLQE